MSFSPEYPTHQPPVRLFKCLGFYTHLRSMAKLKHSQAIQWSVVNLFGILCLYPLLPSPIFCKTYYSRNLCNLLVSNIYKGIDSFNCPFSFFMTPLVMKQFLKCLQGRPPHSQHYYDISGNVTVACYYFLQWSSSTPISISGWIPENSLISYIFLSKSTYKKLSESEASSKYLPGPSFIAAGWGTQMYLSSKVGI